VPRFSVAVAPGAGAISRSATADLPQTWIGEVNVPDRQTTVAAEIEFSFAAIQELTVAEVLPLAELKVTVHELGAAIGVPVGVAGLGISPSPSAGAVPDGSIPNALAVTGGAGWVTMAAAVPDADAGQASAVAATASQAASAVMVNARLARMRSRKVRPGKRTGRGCGMGFLIRVSESPSGRLGGGGRLKASALRFLGREPDERSRRRRLPGRVYPFWDAVPVV